MKRPQPIATVLGLVALGAVIVFLISAPWLPNKSVATRAAAALAATSPRPHATPSHILTLEYFAAPCHVRAMRYARSYEWTCPNGDVYRAPLTDLNK